ncbi:hypothetical protein AU339_004752, partial [Salmonella enterica subsp. enterica serovar Saintpaul]|nr:hypothetical protein [Salmonella enterica subsp. enterica serovar Saintpaul]EDX5363159.1 hypothetical protein [Salmonella enterica subsp. enterica serovar 4,[5],12:i:-]EDY7501875.1 hypothetical protein [Salmonella enterica]EEE9498625.1 hypothetical protein [Salmonella enterica subsp. enterica serovar 4,12:i:-]EDS7022411.1 hypothetical protein [Salmonella enterica subsp. enterica serovar Saintpaul]
KKRIMRNPSLSLARVLANQLARDPVESDPKRSLTTGTNRPILLKK